MIIKDSSLLSIIGINELTNSAQQINSATYVPLETYLPLGIAYLLLTYPISLVGASVSNKDFIMKIEINQLIKKFGLQTTIEIDHLIINDSSALTILGPSGGGKSTLIRLIAGLSYPDRGTIAINDQEIIFKENELLRHRKSIGVVFQSWNLFSHLTALENIVLPLYRVHGLTEEEAVDLSIGSIEAV